MSKNPEVSDNFYKVLSELHKEATVLQQGITGAKNKSEIDLVSHIGKIRTLFDEMLRLKREHRKIISLRATDMRSFRKACRRDLREIAKDSAEFEVFTSEIAVIYEQWLLDVKEYNIKSCGKIPYPRRSLYDSFVLAMIDLRLNVLEFKMRDMEVDIRRR